MRKIEWLGLLHEEYANKSSGGTADRPLGRSLAERIDFILKGAMVISVIGGVLSYTMSNMYGPENYTTFLHNASEGLLMGAVLFAAPLLTINVTQRAVRKWMFFTQGQHHPHP